MYNASQRLKPSVNRGKQREYERLTGRSRGEERIEKPLFEWLDSQRERRSSTREDTCGRGEEGMK